MALRVNYPFSGPRISGSVVVDYTADYTLMCWWRTPDASLNQIVMAVEAADSSEFDAWYVTTAGHVAVYTGPVNEIGSTTLVADTWYHLAFVRSGTDLRAYVNGVLEVSGSHDHSGDPDSELLSLGLYLGGSGSALADARFAACKASARAMSAAEIQSESRQIRPVSALALVGWWPFASGNDSVRLVDWSGRGHTWVDSVGAVTTEPDPPIGWGEREPRVGPPAAASSGGISGTSAGAATTSGTLSGPGALAGASTGTCTPTGSLSGPGELSGSTAGTATTSGSMDGGAVSGSTTGTSTTSGNLSGPGALAAVLAAAATLAGALSGVGGLASATTGTSTVSGSLGGSGPVTGTSTGAASTTGTLTATAAMVGTVTGTSTVTGTFLGGAIGGEAAGSAVVTGTLTATWDMTGGVTGTTVVTGEMTGELFAIATAGTLRDALGNPVVPSIPAGAQWRVVLTGPAADAPCVTIVVRAIEGAG